MKPLEAEQLLGGHAAGILSEAERRALFAAALEDQALFDALADQEVLRELLADPASRAQLLAALAPAKRAIPLWRHPALLGAAASLLVAATAGLAYLRSPQPLAPRLKPPVLTEAPAAKDIPVAKESPAASETQAAPAAVAREERLQKQKATPGAAAPIQLTAPPPPAPPASSQAAVGLSRAPEAAAGPKAMELKKSQAQERNETVQDRADALRSRPAKFLAPTAAPAPIAPSTAAPTPVPGGVPGGVIGGVVGGVIGGGGRAKKAEAPLKADVQAPGLGRCETVIPPAWNLETLADGRAQITVLAPPYAQVLLLQRGPAGLRVVKLLKIEGPVGSLIRSRAQFGLEPGDTVDLYLLNSPVADPTKLPEDGLVDGFRVRVHPPTKPR